MLTRGSVKGDMVKNVSVQKKFVSKFMYSGSFFELTNDIAKEMFC